jgi:hypothetical protein
MKSRMSVIVAAGIALGVHVGAADDARAGNFSFSGSFTQDDNVQLFNFNVGSTSTVTLLTYSYAGSADQNLFGPPGAGTNSAGQTIPGDGFDPILALFDSTGAFINQNDDGGSNVPVYVATGARFDTFFTQTLNPGTYTVSVMESNNFANGPNLSDGFAQQGNGNFTGAAFGGGSNLPFFDATFTERDGHWAFDILNVDSGSEVAAIPEPSTLDLSSIVLGMFGVVWSYKRLKRTTVGA